MLPPTPIPSQRASSVARRKRCHGQATWGCPCVLLKKQQLLRVRSARHLVVVDVAVVLGDDARMRLTHVARLSSTYCCTALSPVPTAALCSSFRGNAGAAALCMLPLCAIVVLWLDFLVSRKCCCCCCCCCCCYFYSRLSYVARSKYQDINTGCCSFSYTTLRDSYRGCFVVVCLRVCVFVAAGRIEGPAIAHGHRPPLRSSAWGGDGRRRKGQKGRHGAGLALHRHLRLFVALLIRVLLIINNKR